MSVSAMEGVFVVFSLKKIRFGMPVVVLMLAGNV